MAHYSDTRARHRHPRRAKHNPLYGPTMILVVATVAAIVYVGYVLWPRWPAGQVSLDAPSVPITIAGSMLNIVPAMVIGTEGASRETWPAGQRGHST